MPGSGRRSRTFGGVARMTRTDHASGTDRCAEVAAGLDVEAVVNVQGDEPLLDPGDVAALADAVLQADADMATLGAPFVDGADRASPHAVKALVDAQGWALGFQRAWPEPRPPGVARILHHLGVYAFRRRRPARFPPSACVRARGRRAPGAIARRGAGLADSDPAGPGCGVGGGHPPRT